MKRLTSTLTSALVFLSLGACDSDDLDSDTEARWAYLGFDRAVDRALNLGLDGFNAASSANIPTQSGAGDEDGIMEIGGQVDQGASVNKGMRLSVTLVDYTDAAFDDPDTENEEVLSLTYNTDPAELPFLDLSLRDIPDGTFSGSLTGDFLIEGSVEANANFALTFSGEIEEDPNAAGQILRTPGTLLITGTVTSGDGTFDVNVAR